MLLVEEFRSRQSPLVVLLRKQNTRVNFLKAALQQYIHAIYELKRTAFLNEVPTCLH